MENSYIKDYTENLLENTFNNDLDRLKSIMYGIDYILNNLQYNMETDNDKSSYNKITTCYLIIKEIIDQEETKENEI